MRSGLIRAAVIFSSQSVSWTYLVVPSLVPPRPLHPCTCVQPMDVTLSCISPSKPKWIPSTPNPLVNARRTKARIAAFLPQAGAPTLTIARLYGYCIVNKMWTQSKQRADMYDIKSIFGLSWLWTYHCTVYYQLLRYMEYSDIIPYHITEYIMSQCQY